MERTGGWRGAYADRARLPSGDTVRGFALSPLPDPAAGAVPAHVLRDTPRAVWAMVALQFVLSVFYAIAVPLFHAPDEHAHVDLLLNASGHVGLEPYAGARFDRRTFTAMHERHLDAVDWRSAPRTPWTGLDGADAPPRESRPTYEALPPSGPTGQVNHTNTNPPLYYAVTDAGSALVRSVLPVRWTWDREVVLLRIIAAALVAPLPWFAFWTARLVGARRRAALAAAAVPLTLPQLTHVAGAVNNDDLVITLSAALTVVLLVMARGDARRRTSLLAGVLAGGAAATKVFGLATPLWILAAIVVAWRRGLAPGTAIRNLLLAALATVAAGGWWVVGQLVRHGTPAPRAFLYEQPSAVETPVLPWIDEVIARTTSTFWGNFGVEQFPIPGPLIVALSVLGLVLLALGWTAATDAAPRVGPDLEPVRPAPRWLALLPVATTIAAVLPAAWSGYERSGLPVGIHGRYLFVGLAGLAAVAGLGVARVIGRRAPLAVLGLAAVTHAFGLVTVLRSYWIGDGLWGSFLAMTAWAPWQQRWTFALMLVIGTSGVVAAWLLAMGPAGQPAGAVRPPGDAASST